MMQWHYHGNLFVETTDNGVKTRLKSRMLEYIERAEKLKESIQKQKEGTFWILLYHSSISVTVNCVIFKYMFQVLKQIFLNISVYFYCLNMYADEKYHEQIHIESDSCGHCYEEIFGRFLDASVTEAHVEDSYIRNPHQACIGCRVSVMSKQCNANSAVAVWSKWVWLVN